LLVVSCRIGGDGETEDVGSGMKEGRFYGALLQWEKEEAM